MGLERVKHDLATERTKEQQRKCVYKNLYTNVHGNVIHNSPKLITTHASFNRLKMLILLSSDSEL